MNKKVLLAMTLMVSLWGCSSIELAPDDAVEHVSMQMAPFVSEDNTRASITIEGSTRHIAWEDTDEVGIFPDAGGYQLGFSLEGQGGKTNADFDGGGWALLTTAKYAAYFPFRFENRDRSRIPVSYAGQVQTGEFNTSHLGPYTFCASTPTPCVNGRVSFTLDQIGTLVWFKLTMPAAATYKEVSLVTDDKLFVVSGTYSLVEGSTYEITPTSTAKAVKVELKNVTTTAPNQVINVFMMTAPTNLTGHSYKVYVKSSDGLFYSADLADKNHEFKKGAAKSITASPVLSDGYNVGIGDWGEGFSEEGDAQ